MKTPQIDPERLDLAVMTYAQHRFQAGPQQCACGHPFPATLKGISDHRRHRFAVVLEATDPAEVFCTECAGPYTDMPWLMEQYGGHWDTCPNRAKAILPEEKVEEGFGD